KVDLGGKRISTVANVGRRWRACWCICRIHAPGNVDGTTGANGDAVAYVGLGSTQWCREQNTGGSGIQLGYKRIVDIRVGVAKAEVRLNGLDGGEIAGTSRTGDIRISGCVDSDVVGNVVSAATQISRINETGGGWIEFGNKRIRSTARIGLHRCVG